MLKITSIPFLLTLLYTTSPTLTLAYKPKKSNVTLTQKNKKSKPLTKHNAPIDTPHAVSASSSSDTDIKEKHIHHPNTDLNDYTQKNAREKHKHLVNSIKKGDLEATLDLMEEEDIHINTQIDDQGNAILHYTAIFFTQDDLQDFLEEYEEELKIDTENKFGLTPLQNLLHNAGKYPKLRDNLLEKAQILVEAGADINKQNNQPNTTNHPLYRDTALTYALKNNHNLVARYILEHFDVDILRKGAEGLTAIEIVVAQSQEPLLELMITQLHKTLHSKSNSNDYLIKYAKCLQKSFKHLLTKMSEDFSTNHINWTHPTYKMYRHLQEILEEELKKIYQPDHEDSQQDDHDQDEI